MRVWLLGAIFSLSLSATLGAQQVGAALGLYSRYVWRGEAQTTTPAFQPEVSLSHGAVSGGVWRSVARGAPSETNVWAEAGTETLSVGWITYDFTAHELYGTLALGVARLYAAHDLGGAGTYWQPGLSVAARGVEWSVAYGFGQDLEHVEFGASREISLGAVSVTPSIAARPGLAWGGVTLSWGNE